MCERRKYRSNRHLAYDYTVDSGIINLTFHDHRLCCVKVVNQFQCLQFSVILGGCKDCLLVETKETRRIVGRRASVCATRFFTGDVLNLHFLAADSFRYGRRRGLNENANACWPSRRKYSRTLGGHRDGTNGGMSIKTFIVDFRWPVLSPMLATRACASTGTIRSLMVLKQMHPSRIFVCARKLEKCYFLE